MKFREYVKNCLESRKSINTMTATETADFYGAYLDTGKGTPGDILEWIQEVE